MIRIKDLSDEDFKAANINMVKELKETWIKSVKGSVMTIYHKIKNINKEI